MDSPTTDAPASQRLERYLRVLRRRLPLIVLVTLVVTAVAVGLSATSTKQYDATAKVLLSESEPINALIDPSAQARSNDPEREVNTKVELIKVEPVADRVRRQLKLSVPLQRLLDKVTAEVESNSSLVSITARDPEPARAAAIANAFAKEYAGFRRGSARGSIEEAAKLARTQFRALSPTERASTQGRQLAQRQRELEIAGALQTGGVEVVRRADPPTSAAEPRPLFTGVLAALLGLLLSAGVALAIEFLDKRMKDEEEAESFFAPLPVLASIPRPRSRKEVIPRADRAQAEAFSTLATSLRFFDLPDLGALMFTSASPEEGKTSVSLGLARSLAALGQSVILIDADLRRPRLAEIVGAQATGGLSTVLVGVASIDRQLVEVDAGTARRVEAGESADGATFRLLPAGPVPPNPQRLLARTELAEVLADARARADIVLVDTAPVGTVNDAVAIANYVDGTIMLARIGRTRRDAARRALQTLRNLETQVLGVVLTDTRPTQSDYGDTRLYTAQASAERASL